MKLATQTIETKEILARMLRPRLIANVGPLTIRTYEDATVSYRLVAEALCSELEKLGIRTECLQDSCSSATLAILPPASLRRLGSLISSQTIVFTSNEAPRLGDVDLEILSSARALIVPSHWNASCFSAQGLDLPIYVCPFGFHQEEILTHRFYPSPRRFGTMFHGQTGLLRKNSATTIRAFLLAFPVSNFSDVQLHVKCSEDAKKALCSELAIADDLRIVWNTKTLPTPALYSWISSMDAGIFSSSCEGFGLGPLEFIASGVPIATTYFGGQTEYLPVGCFHKLEAPLFDAQDTHTGLGVWAYPSTECLISAFRDLYSNYSDWVAKAQLASRLVADFSWENCAKRLERILRLEGCVS